MAFDTGEMAQAQLALHDAVIYHLFDRDRRVYLIDIGRYEQDGQVDDRLAIRFHVDGKIGRPQLQAMGKEPLNDRPIRDIPTMVMEGQYRLHRWSGRGRGWGKPEILVDLSNTEESILLMSYAFTDSENPVQNRIQEQLAGGTDESQQFKILELRPKMESSVAEQVPAVLNTIKRHDPNDAVMTRRFVLEAFTINGKRMDHERIDEVVRTGDTEIWEITNNSPIYHPFHIHGVQFQILGRNGMEPPAYQQGWEDTVIVTPGETVTLMMEFPDYPHPNLLYMYHCHILTHEDMGMMGQFVVVDDASEQAPIESPITEVSDQDHSAHENPVTPQVPDSGNWRQPPGYLHRQYSGR